MDKAVALKYHSEAPVVVSKARGLLLNKLLKIADDESILVYKDSDLAEVLYKLDTGVPIPEDLFVAVASVMLYCYQVSSDFRSKIFEAD